MRNVGFTISNVGSLLAAGFANGTVDILDAISLGDECSDPFQDSRGAVIHMSFSHNSQYFATAVSSFLLFVLICPVFSAELCTSANPITFHSALS